jgi:hypothetical protein
MSDKETSLNNENITASAVYPPEPTGANQPQIIPFQAAADPNKAAIAMLERELPERLAFQRIIARTVKARFDGYVEAGFTRAEAMELIKGVNPLKE